MKLKFVKLIAIAVAIFGVTWSCQKETVSSNQEDNQSVTVSKTKKTILGRKLQNPYSVENMQKAWQNLKSTSKLLDGESTDISVTHLYLKFKPKNEAELDILQQDSTLVLYTYPMDYEIKESGDYYHDPEIPAGQPTYQYCAVKVDKPLPNGIAYDVLEELFIPDDNEGENLMSSDAALDSLVDEALRITNNLEPEINRANQKRSKWRPAGRIQVWDDEFNRWEAVQGIQVRARRWFTTHTGFTNSGGWYSCDGRFKRAANYSIKWERYHYSIRSGASGQALLNGPKRKGDWDVNINDDSLQQFYAFIHLGALHYYYGNILGLKRPPLNGTAKPQMKIGAYNKDGRSNHDKDRRLLGIRNRIEMYRYQNGTLRDCLNMYRVSMHELAHASHWELRKNKWSDKTSDKLQESWAIGVDRELVRLRYTSYNSRYENETFNYMINNGQSKYTALIIDLIDTNNQGSSDRAKPFDRVNGYSISQIENVLHNCDNISNLRDQLYNNYPTNGTKEFLNELFEQYINLSR